MIVLFTMALVTTLSYITNVKAQDLPGYFYQYFQTEEPTMKYHSEVPEKQGSPIERRSPIEAEEKPAIKKESEPLFEAEGPTEVVTATGYTAGYESTGKTMEHPAYGVTYSGVEVRRDNVSTIAADPNLFPIGTLLYIPGYGYGVVADTGSAIKGRKIDLYYDTVEDVYNEWGKRKVEVQVIKKGDGTLEEAEVMALNKEGALPAITSEFKP